STIETKPTAVWQTTARSPTSSTARGSGCVSIESTTRKEARSTTASRASASHVTSACSGRAASAERQVRGADPARARNARRFTSGLRAHTDGESIASVWNRMSHPELTSEQAYVDRAYVELERMRAAVAGAGDRVDGEVAQAAMDAWAAKRLRTF